MRCSHDTLFTRTFIITEQVTFRSDPFPGCSHVANTRIFILFRIYFMHHLFTIVLEIDKFVSQFSTNLLHLCSFALQTMSTSSSRVRPAAENEYYWYLELHWQNTIIYLYVKILLRWLNTCINIIHLYLYVLFLLLINYCKLFLLFIYKPG